MTARRISNNKVLRAFVIGIALGDGNLSNPNGRATRLRVTCDRRYPKLAEHIKENIQKFLPENKVSYVQRAETYMDISCFSNHWEKVLGWKVGRGSKIRQSVSVPNWIKKKRSFIKSCLRGLLQTDGSFYVDRGYPMLNFTNHCKSLALDVEKMMQKLGYNPHTQAVKLHNGVTKYTVRLSKNVTNLAKDIKFWKA